MESKSTKKLSPAKRFLGLATILVVSFVCLCLGMRLSPRHSVVPPVLWMTPASAMVLAAFGVFILVLAAVAYFVILFSCALTFRYRRPVFAGFKIRYYLAYLVLSIPLTFGIAALLGAPLSLIVLALIPSPFTPFGCIIACFFFAQCFFIWFQVLTPMVPKLIGRRLKAMGLARLPLDRGTYVGLSDPTKSSFKKLTLVEDDVGFLWFENDMLIYRGDSIAWQIRRYQMQPIERKADAGATISYFGAVDVLIRFYDDNGINHHYRLHAGRGWTMTARAREMDRLAEVLEAWRNGMTPLLGAARKGFEVVQNSAASSEAIVTPANPVQHTS